MSKLITLLEVIRGKLINSDEIILLDQVIRIVVDSEYQKRKDIEQLGKMIFPQIEAHMLEISDTNNENNLINRINNCLNTKNYLNAAALLVYLIALKGKL